MTHRTAGARLTVRDMTYIAVFAAVIAVCAWITIPAGDVPFTLQTFGVFAAVGVLGGRRGTIAVLLYLMLGAVGLPVFSGFGGGLGVLMGVTGGYIAGFLLSALVMWAAELLWGRSAPALAAGMVLGLLACYAMGTAWYMVLYAVATGPVGALAVLAKCVVPFVVPDLCKIALALLLTRRVARFAR